MLTDTQRIQSHFKGRKQDIPQSKRPSSHA